jgi:hypothetical protein
MAKSEYSLLQANQPGYDTSLKLRWTLSREPARKNGRMQPFD